MNDISARGRVDVRMMVVASRQAAAETREVMKIREERGDHLIAQSQGLRHAIPTAVSPVTSLREIDIYA